MSLAKSISDISLYMMAVVFLFNAGLSIKQSRQKEGVARISKRLLAVNWGLFGLTYIILVARLYIPLEQASLHIALYRILLICDVIALGCILLYISLKYADKLPKLSVVLKVLGAVQALVVALLVLFAPGFDVKQSDLYVEIVPSPASQAGIALSMVATIVCLLTTAVLLGQKNKKRADLDKAGKTRERRDVLILALFILLMIVHIPLPLMVGYELFGSVVVLIFRILICTTIVLHTRATQ